MNHQVDVCKCGIAKIDCEYYMPRVNNNNNYIIRENKTYKGKQYFTYIIGDERYMDDYPYDNILELQPFSVMRLINLGYSEDIKKSIDIVRGKNKKYKVSWIGFLGPPMPFWLINRLDIWHIY